jgi:phosphomannomutase
VRLACPGPRRVGKRRLTLLHASLNPTAGHCHCPPSAVPPPRAATPSSASHSPDALAASYKRLQNGSDIRGVALPGLPDQPVTLSPGVAFFLGQGLADWLAARKKNNTSGLRVAIGRDPRLSGPAMEAALAAGLASRGVAVATCGLATTPAMFLACIHPGHAFDAGVMVTASHLPWNRNGFKFFTADGGFEKGDVTALLKAATEAHGVAVETDPSLAVADGSAPPPDGVAALVSAALATPPGSVTRLDFMPVYASHLRRIIAEGLGMKESDKPLSGLRIVVDAGNGSGGFLATDVLAPLGADTAGSQYLDPDGTFPNHIPNPEDAAAMRAGVAMVRAARADLGIVLDTDVDRSAVVAASGEPINGNRYIALMADIVLRKYPGTTIVTDSVTSDGLSAYIQSRGGRHLRFKRGYRNVIGKGMEINAAGGPERCELMMETSGHGAMAENAYLDDGTYSASQIVIALAASAAAGGPTDVAAGPLADLVEPADSVEFRLRLADPDFGAAAGRVLAAFREWVASGRAGPAWSLEPENYEGWRARVDETSAGGTRGWALLRGSLHDPLLVLNAESSVAHGTCAIIGDVLSFFENGAVSPGEVDIAKLYDGASACTIRR